MAYYCSSLTVISHKKKENRPTCALNINWSWLSGTCTFFVLVPEFKGITFFMSSVKPLSLKRKQHLPWVRNTEAWKTRLTAEFLELKPSPHPAPVWPAAPWPVLQALETSKVIQAKSSLATEPNPGNIFPLKRLSMLILLLVFISWCLI